MVMPLCLSKVRHAAFLNENMRSILAAHSHEPISEIRRCWSVGNNVDSDRRVRIVVELFEWVMKN